MIYVKKRYIGDHHQSIRVVINGERMIIVVFSKAGIVRCVSSKMLLNIQLQSSPPCRGLFISAGSGALHERIGRVDRTFQNLFRGLIVEMMEGKVEHSALFSLWRNQSHRLCRVYRLLDVRDILALGCDCFPSFDIWPQIRKDKSDPLQTGQLHLLIQTLLDEWCGSAGTRTSINIGIFRRFLRATQLIDEDLAGLYSGWAAAGDGHAPCAKESLMGVFAQPGRAPCLIFNLC